MSSLLSSDGQNDKRYPRNGIFYYRNKALKQPRTDQGLPKPLSSNSFTPKPLKATPPKIPCGGSVNHQSSDFTKPKPSPKPLSVYPERLGCDPWMIQKYRFPSKPTENSDNPNYSEGSGTAELGRSYKAPDPSDVVFKCEDDSSLTHSLGNGGRFSGSGLWSIECPNRGAYAKASPESGIDLIPLFPYQNRRLEQGEYGGYGDKRGSEPRGGERYWSKAFEMNAMKNPLKRRELDQMIGPEKHKRAKELLLFKDGWKTVGGFKKYFDANEGAKTELDLSLHL